MVKKVYTISETSEGEFECRGEAYHSLVIYDLDKLNATAKAIIEEKYLTEWLKEGYTPLSKDGWGFADLLEEYEMSDDSESVRVNEPFEYDSETLELDLEDPEQQKQFIETVKDFIEDKSHMETINSYIVENVMTKIFTESQLKEADITKSIQLTKKTSAVITFGDQELRQDFTSSRPEHVLESWQ